MAKKKSPVDELWETAKAGTRKLTAVERRRVLVYLEEIGQTNYSNYELARIFKVSDTIITLDKKRMVATYAATLTPDAAMLFVARHLKDIEELIGVAKRGLNQNASGTLGERFYVDTLCKLMRERFNTYEEVGIVKKELGNLNISKEEWVATVDVESGECGVHKQESTDE